MLVSGSVKVKGEGDQRGEGNEDRVGGWKEGGDKKKEEGNRERDGEG